jgi:pyrroline-5-carboxylate reductase
LESKNIGFIGAGNMASSLISGLLKQGVAVDNLWAADIDCDKLSQLTSSTGIRSATSSEIAASADIILLAVKPQVMKQVCLALQDDFAGHSCLLISIAAGISIPHLQAWLVGSAANKNCAIVRCMPNTPALVGEGATALFASPEVNAEQRGLAEQILSAVGLSVWVEKEADIDIVTALSGSGPAYFFLLMEAMQVAAAEMGLDKTIAKKLTYQTALGAANLVMASSEDTGELRRKVTSPGGTTEQAITTFESGDFGCSSTIPPANCSRRFLQPFVASSGKNYQPIGEDLSYIYSKLQRNRFSNIDSSIYARGCGAVFVGSTLWRLNSKYYYNCHSNPSWNSIIYNQYLFLRNHCINYHVVDHDVFWKHQPTSDSSSHLAINRTCYVSDKKNYSSYGWLRYFAYIRISWAATSTRVCGSIFFHFRSRTSCTPWNLKLHMEY